MNRISSREEALFSDVLTQPTAERGAFLAKACGADHAPREPPPACQREGRRDPRERRRAQPGALGGQHLRDMRTGESTSCELGITQANAPQYLPDGRFFAAPSQSGFAKLWHTATRQEAATFTGSMFGVHSVGFSPNGARLVTGSGGDEAVKGWDVESGQHLLTFTGKGSISSRTAFSASGDVLGAYSMLSKTLHLWRAPSWEEITAAEKATAAKEQKP